VAYNGTVAVQGVSFDVRPGEVFGILGPSGAGKSSLLAALTGLTPSTGEIHMDGRDVSEKRPRDRRFGNVYQDFRLFDWMTVYENVAFGCRALGWGAERIRERVDWAVKRMGLASLTGRKASDLSGGQRQRVGIARALAFEPHALFLDEPFSDLDPPLRVRLRRDVLSHIREYPVPVILVTHDRNEAFELCDRIGVMLDGTILQADQPGELWQSPRTLAVAEFIGYANRIVGTLDQIEGAEALFTTSMGQCRARITATPSSSAREAVLVCQPSSVQLAGADEPRGNTLTFGLESVHRTESFYSVTLVNSEGDIWTAHWSAPPSVTPGETIQCTVLPEHLIAFPPGRD
jgi:ABC-type Fe3+/spermidine/putrescine transport system ATPase subunit